MKGLETIMGDNPPMCYSRCTRAELMIGYAKWIGRYAESDCVLVEILLECGAVPFVRTNVPQTLMVLLSPRCFFWLIYKNGVSGARQ